MRRVLAFLKKYRYSSTVFLILGIVLVASIVLFSLGYRFTPGLSLQKAGRLIITDVHPGASIYIDHEYSGQPSTTTMLTLLSPGSHMLIVSTQDFQPWNEIVSLTAGSDTRVRPVYVPKVVKAEPLKENTEQGAREMLASITLPSLENPLSLSGGCAHVYADYGRILAVASTSSLCSVPPYLCQTDGCNPTIIFSSADPISGVTAFPGRDDVLVIAAGSRVYVLELDPREPRFFAPLIHGQHARVIPWSAHSIVTETDEGIREISL